LHYGLRQFQEGLFKGSARPIRSRCLLQLLQRFGELRIAGRGQHAQVWHDLPQ
jgi:hypothetical protein